MTFGARIAERLTDLGISQSELARRTHLPQTTVNSLIRAGRRSSPHLIKIARELGTTPSYLIGETDDPTVDAPAVPELTFSERELVDCYRSLPAADQAALMHIACSMAGKSGTPETVHAPHLEFGAEPAR